MVLVGFRNHMISHDTEKQVAFVFVFVRSDISFFVIHIARDKLQTQKKKTNIDIRVTICFFLSFFSNLHTTQAEEEEGHEKERQNREKVIHMHNTKHYLQNIVNIGIYI